MARPTHARRRRCELARLHEEDHTCDDCPTTQPAEEPTPPTTEEGK